MPFGFPGALVAIFLIFMVDAAIFPALPEVFIVLFYFLYPGFGMDAMAWAAALLVVGVAGDLAGNFALYWFVRNALQRRNRMPKIIERAMRRWTSFLLVRDERTILLNRIAPIVPLTGAFIAVCNWNVRRALLYVAAGGAAKYAALLALTGWFGVAFSPETAQLGTLIIVLLLVAASAIAGRYRRRSAGGAMP